MRTIIIFISSIFIISILSCTKPIGDKSRNNPLDPNAINYNGGDNHGFEDGPFTWEITSDIKSKACISMYQSPNYHHTGNYSLQLMYNLSGNTNTPNTSGCIELDLTKINLAGHSISAYIYCPTTNSGGGTSTPNVIALYAKDINLTWHQSSWSNIGPSQTGFWKPLSWNLPVSNWASNIRILGLKIAVSGTCATDYKYQGPYYLDDYYW